ncbi:MAG: M23 family metallopeptidase [Butyricicoccaceae bacterium]
MTWQRQAARQSSRSAPARSRSPAGTDGYGNYISIDHGGGLMSFYGHRLGAVRSKGAKVTAGQKIAAVGTTGSSTGCHLHFGMHKNGSSVNPLNYVSSGDTLAKYSGSKSSGTATNTVKALFTAYYPANNAMEGGFLDALGNKLEPVQAHLRCRRRRAVRDENHRARVLVLHLTA